MIIAVALVNVFSAEINAKAPQLVTRTLQVVMVKKGSAVASIRSSSNWRTELRNRALDEWRTDSRTLFFGRATYRFDEGDMRVRRQVGGYYAGIETALRRGATHNLTTDLLVQYGAVGFSLYMFFLLAFTHALWQALKEARRIGSQSESLLMIMLIYFIVGIPISFLAGSFIGMWTIWVSLVAFVLLAQSKNTVSARKEANGPDHLNTRQAISVE